MEEDNANDEKEDENKETKKKKPCQEITLEPKKTLSRMMEDKPTDSKKNMHDMCPHCNLCVCVWRQCKEELFEYAMNRLGQLQNLTGRSSCFTNGKSC
jgi:hypothetical protein